MKRIISHRLEAKFMKVMLEVYYSSPTNTIDLNNDSLNSLRKRRDYEKVLIYLRARKFLTLEGESNTFILARPTDEGIAYFETRLANRIEVLWTRGLAITAIIISIIALGLQIASGLGFTGCQICAARTIAEPEPMPQSPEPETTDPAHDIP